MFGAFRRPRSVRIDMAQCTTAPDGSDLAAAGGPLAGAVLVGGAVRDLLLGRPLTDLDWLVRDPRERAEALARSLAGSVVALDPERGHWRVVAAGRRWDLVAPETATGAPPPIRSTPRRSSATCAGATSRSTPWRPCPTAAWSTPPAVAPTWPRAWCA
jgi:hypothetical protein